MKNNTVVDNSEQLPKGPCMYMLRFPQLYKAGLIIPILHVKNGGEAKFLTWNCAEFKGSLESKTHDFPTP